MVLKTEIEIAYKKQQLNLMQMKQAVDREYYLIMNLSSTHIEVVSGVRRCGKSTLLKHIMKHIDGKVIYFNFEDSRVFDFELSDFQKLDDLIGSNIGAYFFDEIQNVSNWEIFIRELHERGEKIFITGSNASLLSRELGTRLTGRHLRHELFPFSYPEYLTFKKVLHSEKSFLKYFKTGGFPEFLVSENQELLQNLLKDIVLRDIAIRYGVRNTKTLMEISLYLISNVGKEFTYNSLKKTFSVGSVNSIADYLSWLEDSYLLFFLPKFSYSSKTSSVNPRKVYAIDNGLILANSLSFTEDSGRLLENLVYLHLRKHFEKLFYFREKGECDFIAFQRNECKYIIQVCEELHSENKKREINGLIEAMEFFNKAESYILTKNQEDELVVNEKKIYLVPVSTFILNFKSLSDF